MTTVSPRERVHRAASLVDHRIPPGSHRPTDSSGAPWPRECDRRRYFHWVDSGGSAQSHREAGHDIVIDIPYRSPRAWASLLVGTLLVGVGLGFMIDAGYGVSPLDAFFTGVSQHTGLSVGVILFVFSALMVLMSWALGLTPTIGTLITFIGIAILVDLTRLAGAAIGVPEWPASLRVAWWILGLLLFCGGVLGVFSCDLGASPYDQLARAIAFRTGRSLGFGRIILDTIALLSAIVLGGSWGIGTVVILLVVPLVLNRVLPHVKPRIHRDPLHDRAA